MIKRIKKVGNSNALFLDKALLELLGLDEGAAVQLTVHDGALIVTPADARPVSPARFEAALQRVVTRRRPALRRLAE